MNLLAIQDLELLDPQLYRQGKAIAYTNCKTGEGLGSVMSFILEKLLFISQTVLEYDK